MLSKISRGENARGFSLLEVMVALVVISVGLLGILKLEAAAVASTTVAAKRSLAAIEAASLAASMHANRGYWTSFDASNANIIIRTTAITTTGAPNLLAAIAAAPNCATPATPCSVTNMAAYDLIQWATVSMQPLLGTYVAVISCSVVTPVTCNINISWNETAVSINAQEDPLAAQNAAFQKPSYTLYVEP
jgi:type IV pilus assembly protein PilV